MNHRERVLVALDHREPDRVPIEFGCSLLSSILDREPFGYRALCKHLGIDDFAEPEINFYLSSVSNVDARIMDRFGADLRWVVPGGPEVEHQPNGTTIDPAWGFVLTSTNVVNTFVDEAAPLRGIKDWSAIDDYRYWPNVRDPRIWVRKTSPASGASTTLGSSRSCSANTPATSGAERPAARRTQARTPHESPAQRACCKRVALVRLLLGS